VAGRWYWATPPRRERSAGKNRTIRASDDEWGAWREAADAEDRAVSDWARDELNAAARRDRGGR